MHENVVYLGIKIPIGKKEHIQKFKNFASKNLFQRETQFILKEIQGKTLFVVDSNISDEESPLKKLLVRGFAKLENDANNKLDSLEYLNYKSLQDQGMKARRGIWVDFKVSENDS